MTETAEGTRERKTGLSVADIWSRLRDTMTTRTVVGDPVVVGDVTVIPVVRAAGASGRCRCQCPGRSVTRPDTSAATDRSADAVKNDTVDDGGSACGGEASGVAVRAHPVGVFVVRGGEVSWQPAVDMTKVIVGGQLVGLAALLVIRSMVKRRRRG